MKKVIISMAISLIVIAVITNVNAATTFLPDWMETEPKFEINYDDPMCDESGLFHKASGCPAPKIFDEYCPFDSDWISECYCPSVFSKTCSSPYIGDTRVTDPNSGYASCDGLWVACCNSSCPSGTSRTNPGGCGGSTYNDCGDICYYPYEECCTPASSETGCTCGTYSCSDGCGGTRTCCSSCPTSDDTIDDGTDNTDDTDDTDNTDDTDGTDNTDDEEESCSYSVTESECSSQCKNTGSNSCSINGTTYYDSCGSSLCSSDQVCYNGSCCTPDDFEWPEPACGCENNGWVEEDIGCGLKETYCRKPKQCSGGLLTGCDGVVMECDGKSCCCPTGRCYDDIGQNMCDCASDFDK